MPARIPIYKAEIFEKLDKDKEEIKREMNDLTLLIIKKFEQYREIKKPIIKSKVI